MSLGYGVNDVRFTIDLDFKLIDRFENSFSLVLSNIVMAEVAAVHRDVDAMRQGLGKG